MPLSERSSATLPSPSTPAHPSSLSLPSSLPPGSASLKRAERHIAQGSHRAAVDSLKQAIAQGADESACRLRIAQVYAAAQQWSEALAAANEAARLAPEQIAAWECVMTVAQASGNRQRALLASEKLIKLSPRYLPAHTAQAEIYLQLGQPEAALRALNTLIRLDPANAAHHIQKGMLFQHQGEVALAVHEFSTAVGLEPDGPQVETALEALGILDAHQMNSIMLLAIEDPVFRVALARDAMAAVAERGFSLSPMGQHMMHEMGAQAFADLPRPSRRMRYN